jgi:phage repressor protein C with HTH and peptisase S24 domain
MTPGDRIRDARKLKGWTQSQLAEACGWEGASRVGNYESGARHPSREDWIKLGAALEESPAFLQFGEDLFREITPSTRMPKAAASRAVRRQVAIRSVPVIGFVVATPDQDGYFDDASYPPGAGEGYLTWPTRDANAYALRVRGDSMQPRIRPGEVILVEPGTNISPGSDVVVRCKDGRKMVKQLLFQRGQEVTLGSINIAHRQVTIDVSEIESMHYVSAIVPAAAVNEEGHGQPKEDFP